MLAVVPLLGACAVQLASATGEDAQRPTVDAIPGLGVSAEAALRDDTIAYWEAWQRAETTSGCMQAAGFSWQPEVLYPQETIDQIATSLSVTATRASRATLAEDLNAEIFDQLTPRQQDSYTRALYGESAQDMEKFNETGEIPETADDSFARGGCVGESLAKVGSIWDLKREVGPGILELEREIKQAQFDQVRIDYGACAAGLGLKDVDGPEDIDQLLAEATTADDPASHAQVEELLKLTTQVSSQCDDTWAVGTNEAHAHAVSVVHDRHTTLFDAQAERYGDALAEIATDKAFLVHLSAAAGSTA